MLKNEYVTYRGKQKHYDELKNHSIIPLDVICDECGKEFISTKAQLERNGHQLCQACALWKSHGSHLAVGEKYGRLKVIGESERHGYSVCECECGIVSEYKNTALKRGTTKSCGCLQRDKAIISAMTLGENQKRESHPNWKGGKTNDRHTKEASKEFKDIREKLLENAYCAFCGDTNNLVTHHITPYVVSPDLFVNEDNMAVLCDKCHRAYHHKYGFKGNKEMFAEFLADKTV